MAHMMYALRLMNRKNLFSSQKKQCMHLKTQRVKSLSYFFNLVSKYTSIARIKLHAAMIKDPKAIVPKWYLWNTENESVSALGKYDSFCAHVIHL